MRIGFYVFGITVMLLSVVPAVSHAAHSVSGNPDDDIRHFSIHPYHLPISLALAGLILLSIFAIKRYISRKRVRT